MHSPAYTAFSSPRCKAYKQHTESGEDTCKYSDTLTIIISIGVSALLLMIFLGKIKGKMYKLLMCLISRSSDTENVSK
jgi:hypothetical protein